MIYLVLINCYCPTHFTKNAPYPNQKAKPKTSIWTYEFHIMHGLFIPRSNGTFRWRIKIDHWMVFTTCPVSQFPFCLVHFKHTSRSQSISKIKINVIKRCLLSESDSLNKDIYFYKMFAFIFSFRIHSILARLLSQKKIFPI